MSGSFVLNINSSYRTTGTIDNFTIQFPWPITYSPHSIKVLQIIPPSAYGALTSNTLYVASNIVSGIDIGYVPINNVNIQNNVNFGPVIVVFDANNVYQNTQNDPFLICTSSMFGAKYTLPQPDRNLHFSLLNVDGTSPASTTDWNITISCKIASSCNF